MIDGCVTRKQLVNNGLSRYHAFQLTKHITPQRHEGRAFAFSISDVIEEADCYLARPRVKESSCKSISRVIELLSASLDNVVTANFLPVSRNTKLSHLAMKALERMRKNDSRLANIKLSMSKL